MQFECDRCALCCGDVGEKPRNILLLKTEAQQISEETSKKIIEFADRTRDCRPYAYRMRKTAEGKCVFLRDSVCAVYAVRPMICRFYPFELRNGGNDVYVFLATDECPRVGEGPSLTKQHFEELFRYFVALMEKNKAQSQRCYGRIS